MFTLIATIVVAQTTSAQFAELLDVDGDGVIHPMEAADAIEMMYEEEGVGLPVAEVEEAIQEHQEYLVEMAELYLVDFDVDGDGEINFEELPSDLLAFAEVLDADNDKAITLQEIIKLNPDSDEVYARVETEMIFADLDEDSDGDIELEVFVKIDPEFAELVIDFDANKNKKISKEEMLAGFALLDAPAYFVTDGDVANMYGTIGSSTPFRIKELVLYHPEVKTIVMVDVPGSVDDDSSLRAARIVRQHGLNTHVPSDGEVASGGTDFFQAGLERTCEEGALFGVHSWAEFNAEGIDYPKDDEVHTMYLEYCDEMGIPQSFYWYTLEAAPADEIHYMTNSELETFSMLTAPIMRPSAKTNNSNSAD